MKKLNKIAAPALLAALVLGAASPAMAQYGPNQRTPYRADQIRAQINELQVRIDRNDNRRNRLSPREATALRNDVRNLQGTFRAYNRNGLDRREMATLNGRIDNIRTRLHIEANDWNNHRW
jgi:hypothetical protein